MKNQTGNLEELKKEWQEKYGVGNCRELIADGKSVFVFDPCVDLNKIKMVIAARQKSVGHMVDAVLNNCWLGGEESLRQDEAFKSGIEAQVEEMIDIPEAQKEELTNGNIMVKVGTFSIELKKVTRGDLRYGEDRNPDRKPLVSQGFVLERVAVNQDALEELKKNPRTYLAVCILVDDLRDKKYVEVKKF